MAQLHKKTTDVSCASFSVDVSSQSVPTSGRNEEEMDSKNNRPKPMPNALLRHERYSRNWTLQDLADKLYAMCIEEGRKSGISSDTVGRWERGRSQPEAHYRAKLCTLYGKSSEELGLFEEQERSRASSVQQGMPAGQLRTDSANDAESEEMDRRQTLQLLGAAGTALVLGVPTVENIEELVKLFSRRETRLQKWVIDSLEDGTHLRWQLYYTSRNSLTEEGLFQHIERLEHLADWGGVQEAKLYPLLIQNYQLAGSLARDNFRYTRAKQYFHEAQQLASEIQSPDLAATAVARYAVSLMRQAGGDEMEKRYSKLVGEALTLYQSAAEMAAHAEAHVRAYVLSGLAEALARNGHREACYRTLDQAEAVFNRGPLVSSEEDIAHVRLTLQSLEDARGECYVLFGEPLKGLDYLQTAQRRLNPTVSRNLCRLLMQQSEAHLAAGAPDECVHYALQGLHLARTLESTSNINWSREIHTKLLRSQWKGEPVVVELEAALAG
jgi:transcriptional regulator with XRE-family HTH domain